MKHKFEFNSNDNKTIINTMEKYECKHCEGIVQIITIKDTQKGTLPTIEFCPFCGISNAYPKEIEDD